MSRKKTKKKLIASGSPRAEERIDTERPQSGKGIEKPPAYLNKEERKIWARLLPKALEMKTYKNADHDSFAQFCRAQNTLLIIQAKLAKAGFVSKVTYEVGQGEDRRTVTATKENPLFLTEKRCILNYNTFAAQFGFNPMARTRLQITPYQTKRPADVEPARPGQPGNQDAKLSLVEKMMNIEKTG